MILIHPPVAKLSEPPAGIAKLIGALNRHTITCRVVDANFEGIMSLLRAPQELRDTWTKRAFHHLTGNLASLSDKRTYTNLDRYKRAVADVNRVLGMSARSFGIQLSLANYQDHKLLPVRSIDLIRASERPEDNPFYSYFEKRFCDLMSVNQSSFVGFSLNYLSQAVCTFAMIGYLKKICPDVKIILGGGLVTSWMRRPNWNAPFAGLVDEWVAGPGEGPLLSILGKTPSGTHVTPDYEDLSMNTYLSPGFVLPYSGSNGCYWNNCSFCPEKAEGNPYRPAPSGQVIIDLNELIQRRKPSLIHMLDNAMSPALLSTLVDHPLGAPWYGFARISRQLTDPDFCRALKRSGCVMLKLGLESGNQDVLDDLQKGINLEEASVTLRNLKKAGIATYVYLLFGTPAETLDTARETLRFTALHVEEIGFLNCAVFNLPAYGPDVEKLYTEEFYEGDLSLYRNFLHPRGWNRNLVRKFLDREFKRHPAVASIIRRDPPFFTSNHAPFFALPSTD
ncbi:MAG: radical SAM protein [Deltaproteobacteria bacterium]|nr:radical SAM protein [Deltaproteobacteria bacterium]